MAWILLVLGRNVNTVLDDIALGNQGLVLGPRTLLFDTFPYSSPSSSLLLSPSSFLSLLPCSPSAFIPVSS